MLYWGIILFICIIIGVIFGIALHKDCGNENWNIFGIIMSGVIVFCIALGMLIITCEYKTFLASFETQRTIITQMSQSPQFSDNTLIYVADMIDANQKLAEIQGSKKAWGGWSMYPDSVMDVVPIGLEN